MNRLLVITFLGVLAPAIALSDVNRDCMADNTEELSNDALLGTWYEMYRFTMMGMSIPSIWCTRVDFTRPTAEQLAEYKEKYNDSNLPYSLDDNPVLRNDSNLVGIVTGHTRAKFYVLDPKEAFMLSGGYSVNAYQFLADGQYLMLNECAQRGNLRWLYARNRDAPVAEMLEVINNTPELRRMIAQRHCAD